MSFPKFLEINGTRIAWRDLLKMRREQRKAARTAQPVLFELRDDSRPAPERTAQGRFEEPSLFTQLDGRRS
jgi:hypothetical protein